jgi:transcriptional regulator with PAS, ATPase and Fis domain
MIPGQIMDILMEYDWPGNVRELRNVLQRYITLGHLEFFPSPPDSRHAASPVDLDLKEAVRTVEKSLISKALRQADGNRTRAAELLGISRRALFRKMSGS